MSGAGHPDDVIVRDARPGDGDAIAAVTLSAYQQYAASLPAHWEAYRQNIVATLASVGSATQIVAEWRGAIAGTVLLFPTGVAVGAGGPAELGSREVRLLAVAPASRGRGIAAALMRECIERARQSGATAVTLHTTDFMAAAMRLYERLGFARAPELDLEPAPRIVAKGYRLVLT